MPSVIAPPPEPSLRYEVPAPHDDPLGHVLADAPGFAPPQALVGAVTQNVLRGLLSGFVHEPPLAHWYRNAFRVGTTSLAFHDVLGRLVPRLQGTTIDDREMFARAPAEGALGEWVAAFYRLCRRLLPPGSTELEASAPQAHALCRLPWPVRQLAHEIEGHAGLQLYVHGSLATCDSTSYSDVDTLLLISHEWLESGERADELRRIISRAQRWLYVYDPLQHHGFMLVTALDLDRYARSYFPLELLSYAVAMGPAVPQRYKLRESAVEDVSLFRRLSRRLMRMERGEVEVPRTRYTLKLALSEMMLLPTYFLQAGGQVRYKRESFAAVRDFLSPRAQSAMDELSAWRCEWRRTPLEECYRALGAHLPDGMTRRVLSRVRVAPPSATDRTRFVSVLSGMRELANELAQRLEVGRAKSCS